MKTRALLLGIVLWATAQVADATVTQVPTVNTGKGVIEAQPTAPIPFQPNTAGGVNLNAGTSSSNVALPSTDPMVELENMGLVDAYVNLGVNNSVTATTTAGLFIPHGCTIPVYAGANSYVAGITSTGTTAIRVVTGKGMGTASCSNAASVASTIASGAVVSGAFATGSIVDLGTYTSPTTGTANDSLQKLVTGSTSPIPIQVNHGQLIGATEGQSAYGANITENPLLDGCQAVNAEPTTVSNGQKMSLLCGLNGKLINLPYANKENMTRAANNSTTTSAITVMSASGTSPALKGYLVAIQCFNTSGVSDTVTLNDSSSAVFLIPSGGGFSVEFPIPLVSTSTNTAITATPTNGENKEYCNGQGFYGN